MTPEQVRLLFDFNAWANARTLASCEPLSPEEFTRANGSSFPSVRDTLAHIHGAEWVWLERWNGRQPATGPKGADFSSLAALRAAWESNGRALLDFAHSRTQEQLNAATTIRAFDGTPYTHPLWQMMQHVANHGSYHRGQIATFLRQMGYTPQATDLMRFYRERASQASA